jgi:fatty-acyl-CoA synthase
MTFGKEHLFLFRPYPWGPAPAYRRHAQSAIGVRLPVYGGPLLRTGIQAEDQPRGEVMMKINFCHVMSTMAMRYRQNTAIVNLERNRRYTFPEYHRLTNRIANMIREGLGLRRSDVALLILDNDNLSLLHFPAIWKQEATFAFSNLRDGQEEHAWQVDTVNARAVFLETRMLPDYYDFLHDRGCRIVVMDRAPDLPRDVHCFWDLLETASEADNDVALDPREDVPILRFTGGTTGRGKCAMYSMDHFLACRDSAYIQPDFECNEAMRYLAFTPLSHLSIFQFLQAFFAGGTTYTLNAPDLTRWCEAVQAERITHSSLVPTLLYRLQDMNSAATYDLSSLRTILYAAAPIAPTSVEQLIAQFGNVFVQGYGATETLMLASVLNKHDHHARTEVARKRLASAGRVSPDVEIMIMDDQDKPVPVGKVGEIWLRARATIKGYFGNPEGTAAEFVDGFWKSGDLGYVDEDGYLFLVDRKKDMIISGGFNIYAIEVEAALARHPAVLMSAVVGVPHHDWGEAVHAEVVLRDDMTASEDELIACVKQRIGSYKAPKSIVFVDQLPLSPVGKVLRRKVRQRYWEGHDRRIN